MKQFHIRFYESRKIYFSISIGIMLIGLIFNFVFGTKLDIKFTGGAVIKYSYTGTDINPDKVEELAQQATGKQADVTINTNVKDANGKTAGNQITISFAGTSALTLAQQQAIAAKITSQYPKANLAVVESNSIDPSMGRDFLLKCLCAVLLAVLLLIIYIAFRFKKIGGMSAGVMAIIALLHDVAMVYFTFVIFRFPLDDNFIAVVLTILGYSLNDTIIVYDRIRENRKLLGPKTDSSVLVNTSINQTFTRSLYTAGCTFSSIAIVAIVGAFFGLTSVVTFALPMMVGIITGCYSSVCVAGPLYIMWQKHKVNARAASASAKAK